MLKDDRTMLKVYPTMLKDDRNGLKRARSATERLFMMQAFNRR